VVERDGHDVGATNGTSKWKALPHNLSGDHFPPPPFFFCWRGAALRGGVQFVEESRKG